MADQFDNVTVHTRANIYFDGKCVSHSVLFADGSKKTLGVILPSMLTFTTGAAERMELQSGSCRIRLQGATDWQAFRGGEFFEVPANSAFDIDTLETVDYICHFA